MSSTLPSDEVAEDYKSSLEDLMVNDRNQIGVLTVIAKENTEHAQAIARVLENHIRSVGDMIITPCFCQDTFADIVMPNLGSSGSKTSCTLRP